jgi:hypothetical protein
LTLVASPDISGGNQGLITGHLEVSEHESGPGENAASPVRCCGTTEEQYRFVAT